MNILMVTNTYVPHVGGVARSVDSCRHSLEELGHRVLVVTTTFAGAQADAQVVRVPSIEHFANSDFSFPLPFLVDLRDQFTNFAPDVVHSHHPFLLGDVALEIAAAWNIPVVFTHHTQYDKYAHYVAGNSQLASHFIAELATGYCNLCDLVIAPVRRSLRFFAIGAWHRPWKYCPRALSCRDSKGATVIDFDRSTGFRLTPMW